MEAWEEEIRTDWDEHVRLASYKSHPLGFSDSVGDEWAKETFEEFLPLIRDAALAAERAKLAPVIEAALKWEEAQAEMHAASQMHTEEYLECARAAKIAEADLRAQVQALRATPGC